MDTKQPDTSPDLLLAVVFIGLIGALGAWIGDVLIAGAVGAGITIAILEVGAWFSRRVESEKGSGGSGSA